MRLGDLTQVRCQNASAHPRAGDRRHHRPAQSLRRTSALRACGCGLMLATAFSLGCAAAPAPLTATETQRIDERAALPLASPATGDEQQVTVEGRAPLVSGSTASARDAALGDAMRHAVEQVVGTLVDSRTLVENFVTVRDRIYSASDGYVSRYDVLAEGVEADGQTYHVRILATVRRGRVKDDLASYRILQVKTGRKRVMVVGEADPAAEIAAQEAASYVAAAVAGANAALAEREFRVFDAEATAKVAARIGLAAGTQGESELVRSALAQGAELCVLLAVAPGKRAAAGPGRFSMGYATVRAKAFDATTGRLLGVGSGDASERARTEPGPQDWLRAVGAAADGAARLAVARVAPSMIQAAAAVDRDLGTPYQVVLLGYREADVDRVIEFLESAADSKGFRELARQPGHVELEVFWSDVDTTGLNRTLRTEMKARGVELVTKDQAGSRIVFEQPGR